MTFLSSEEHSFYTSEKLVSCQQFAAFLKERASDMAATSPEGNLPVTHLTWDLAREFCRWLSVLENITYRLPTVEEAALIGDRFPHAIWTESTWEGPDATARKVRERFGTSMKVIWDPKSKVVSDPLVGELPFAAYDQLAFAVVTSQKTGRIDRWNRLRTEK